MNFTDLDFFAFKKKNQPHGTGLQDNVSYNSLYHGFVEYLFLIGLKGILERALFLYKVQYISRVEFNGYSTYMFYAWAAFENKSRIEMHCLIQFS